MNLLNLYRVTIAYADGKMKVIEWREDQPHPKKDPMSTIAEVEQRLREEKQARIEEEVQAELKSEVEASLNEREAEVNRLQEELSAKRDQLAADRAEFDGRFNAEPQA